MARKLITSIDTRHPLYQMLPEQRDPLRLKESWMTRILNIKQALEMRGYPVGLHADLQLEIADELVPSNQGLWHLKIADGKGDAERIGDLDLPADARRVGGSATPPSTATSPPPTGKLRTSIRHLAPLYSGYVNAELLAQTGRIQADSSTQRLASSIFAGSSPWMPDFF